MNDRPPQTSEPQAQARGCRRVLRRTGFGLQARSTICYLSSVLFQHVRLRRSDVGKSARSRPRATTANLRVPQVCRPTDHPAPQQPPQSTIRRRVPPSRYRHQEEWENSLASVTTITFLEVPLGTFLTDEYEDLGVVFTDGSDFVSGPGGWLDGAGVNGLGDSDLAFDRTSGLN